MEKISPPAIFVTNKADYDRLMIYLEENDYTWRKGFLNNKKNTRPTEKDYFNEKWFGLLEPGEYGRSPMLILVQGGREIEYVSWKIFRNDTTNYGLRKFLTVEEFISGKYDSKETKLKKAELRKKYMDSPEYQKIKQFDPYGEEKWEDNDN